MAQCNFWQSILGFRSEGGEPVLLVKLICEPWQYLSEQVWKAENPNIVIEMSERCHSDGAGTKQDAAKARVNIRQDVPRKARVRQQDRRTNQLTPNRVCIGKYGKVLDPTPVRTGQVAS